MIERNSQLQRYRELLAGLPVQLLEVPDDVLSSVHLAVIRLQQATADQHRQLFEGLRSAGIGVQLHYSPVHLQPYYRALGFAEGQFPQAVSYASCAISLPLFPGLNAADQQRVARYWPSNCRRSLRSWRRETLRYSCSRWQQADPPQNIRSSAASP